MQSARLKTGDWFVALLKGDLHDWSALAIITFSLSSWHTIIYLPSKSITYLHFESNDHFLIKFQM